MPLSFFDLFQSVGRQAKVLWDKRRTWWVLAAVVLCLVAAFLECLNGKEDVFFTVASFALAAIFGVLKSVVLLADRIGALAYAPIGRARANAFFTESSVIGKTRPLRCLGSALRTCSRSFEQKGEEGEVNEL